MSPKYVFRLYGTTWLQRHKASLFLTVFLLQDKIIDLLSNSGNFLTWHMVKVKYRHNDIHILSWLGLINSIPLAWKTKINHHSSDSQHIGTDAMRRDTFLPDMSVKKSTAPLVKPLIHPPTAQRISRAVFRKIRNRLGKKYTWLLWRLQLNHNCGFFNTKSWITLYLNNRLFKMGYAESPFCSLCKRENETVSHLFCNCTLIQRL